MSTSKVFSTLSLVALLLAPLYSTNVAAKSMYVIANINASPSPIQTYDIQPAPAYLVYQATASVPAMAGGAVGLGLDDSSAKLFVTYEGSATIQLVNATTFSVLGQTTAPGASNLAGIVVDQGKSKVYTVDRETSNLYVYSWNSATDTLTLDGSTYVSLAGVSKASGIALDEKRGRLYVGDRDSTTVRYFNTTTWAEAGSVDLSSQGQTVMGVAIDSVRNLLYTGNAYPYYGSLGKLVKYDLNTSTASAYLLPGGGSGDNILGVAVDEDTGNVFATTGNQGYGGTDTVIVFDSALNVVKNDIGDIGDPTGIVIPRAQVSYNPLNFSKTDNVDPVASGANLTYALCYDNTANEGALSNLTITDDVPAGTSFVSATGPYGAVGNTVTWSVASVAAGAAQVCYDLVVNVTAEDGTQLLNSATIHSDQTPPTTQTQTTDVSAVAPPSGTVDFSGSGGGGATSPLELIFGALSLPILWAQNKKRTFQPGDLLTALLAILIVAIASTAHAAGDQGWYVGAGVGDAQTNTSAADYDAALAGLGYTATSSIDDSNTGWKLFGGYAFTRNWAIEGAYVNFGDVNSHTTVTPAPATANEQQTFVDKAATVHPYSVDGFALAGKGTLPLNGQFALFAKAGVFFWHADIKVDCNGCASSVSTSRSASGTDWTGGVGLGYDFNKNVGLRIEYERYATDRDDVDFYSAGLEYRF